MLTVTEGTAQKNVNSYRRSLIKEYKQFQKSLYVQLQ